MGPSPKSPPGAVKKMEASRIERFYISLVMQTEGVSVARIAASLERETRESPQAVLLLAPVEEYERRWYRRLIEAITMPYALILPPWEEEEAWPSNALWRWRTPRMRWCDPTNVFSRSMHRYAAIKEAFKLADRIMIVDSPEGLIREGHTSTKALIEMQKECQKSSELCFLENGSLSVQSIQSAPRYFHTS